MTGRTPYTEWFMGDHKGIAPPFESSDTPDHLYGESRHLNGMDAVVELIAHFREDVVGDCLKPEWYTHDDQFVILLRLYDDLGDAIEELVRVGWPISRPDGTTVWEGADLNLAPPDNRETVTALATQLKTRKRPSLRGRQQSFADVR